MPRRVTPSQLKSILRQQEQKRKQAINDYNRAADKHNRDLKRSVDDYNRKARAHNAQVRSNRQRLERELRQLASRPSSTRFVTYRASVQTLQTSFTRLESRVQHSAWGVHGEHLIDLSEREAANSVAALNAFLDSPSEEEQPFSELQQTTLAGELAEMSPDLDSRWRGALFSLDPANPDAARHFCASSRELLAQVIDAEAPDSEVLRASPTCATTPQGRPTRRAKLEFVLARKSLAEDEVISFVESDLDNVVTLFATFNEGTHGSAGRFDFRQLDAIKRRVEDAVRFLHVLIR